MSAPRSASPCEQPSDATTTKTRTGPEYLLVPLTDCEVMGEDTRENMSTDGCSRRLTDDEFERYSRQMIVPGMGREGESFTPAPQ